MMSNTSKRKGTRVENKIVKLFENIGIKARRQPMSGSLQDFPHDVKVELLGGLHIEVKARKNGKGFGFKLTNPSEKCTRTISSRYYKDGSECLIFRGKNKIFFN